MKLSELAVGSVAVVVEVRGRGSFRRRLMELGILPGTRVQVVGVAPLGDPLELLVRGSSLSIRRAEAVGIEVSGAAESELSAARQRSEPMTTECAREAP